MITLASLAYMDFNFFQAFCYIILSLVCIPYDSVVSFTF